VPKTRRVGASSTALRLCSHPSESLRAWPRRGLRYLRRRSETLRARRRGGPDTEHGTATIAANTNCAARGASWMTAASTCARETSLNPPRASTCVATQFVLPPCSARMSGAAWLGTGRGARRHPAGKPVRPQRRNRLGCRPSETRGRNRRFGGCAAGDPGTSTGGGAARSHPRPATGLRRLPAGGGPGDCPARSGAAMHRQRNATLQVPLRRASGSAAGGESVLRSHLHACLPDSRGRSRGWSAGVAVRGTPDAGRRARTTAQTFPTCARHPACPSRKSGWHAEFRAQ
jgi:hypothetical protein